MAVFVLDKRGKPLMQCSEKRARLLLDRGRARIHKMLPFTIRVVDRLVEDSQLQPLEIKLDPGSKTTGVAVVRISVAVDAQTGEVQKRVHVLNLFELIHRSRQITEALMGRRGHRRLRRSKLRYRAPRFDNRGNQKKGWLVQPQHDKKNLYVLDDEQMRNRYSPSATDSYLYENGEVRYWQFAKKHGAAFISVPQKKFVVFVTQDITFHDHWEGGDFTLLAGGVLVDNGNNSIYGINPVEFWKTHERVVE